MKYLSINDVAKILGVSVQTLRNWDDSSYLTADKTAGGHRRYRYYDVENFLKGKKNISDSNIISCWTINHVAHLEKLRLEEASKDPRAKACGGFTKEQIGLLLKNQDTVHDEESKSLPLDLFYRLAASYSTPYLFGTRVLNDMTAVIAYKRIRGNKLVCETQSVCACSHHKSYCWEKEMEESFNALIKEIDETCIKDIIYNVKHKIECPYDDLEIEIDNAIKMIDEATEMKEPKIVVYPPELFPNPNGLIKLTDNLKKLSKDFNLHSYEIFVSRLVPDGKVLVANKSEEFGGFNFCPYLLMGVEKERSRVLSMIGTQLLREGSMQFAVIDVV